MPDHSLPILFIRHASTPWNESGRLQGHADVALSAQGRARLVGHRVPDEFEPGCWFSSPALRARQSALLLGAAQARVEPALLEMDWGHWEGERLKDLRLRLGRALRDNEDRGLDFRPEGGESPREVKGRLAAWLERLWQARPSRPVVAVTHKGVIRAALALATAWDMRADFPHRLDWRAAQRFELGSAGLTLTTLNVPLLERAAPAPTADRART